MAGVMMTGDEGKEIPMNTVPSMGSLSGTAKVSGNPDDGLRAEGVNYDSNNSIGVNLDIGEAYPSGTKMTDNTPGDDVN